MRIVLCRGGFTARLCGGHGPLKVESRTQSAGAEVKTDEKRGNRNSGYGNGRVCHMKCREVQSYLEDNAPDRADSVEAAQHVSACVNCHRVVDMRQARNARLRLLRESA